MSDYLSHEYMMSIPAREISDSSQLAANPVVSVVMITYNHEKYVAQAIEGVIMQRCDFPIELLIGEDCSTDGTRAICAAYQVRYPQIIRFITADHNVGMHKNAFRLFGRARGRYLAFCEGDDYWCDDHKLLKQVQMLEGHGGMKLCFSRVGICRENQGNLIAEWSPRKEAVRYEVEDFISGRVTASTCTVCIRREIVSRLPRFFEEGAMGDWTLWVLALVDGYGGYIPERLGVYRLHPTGVWQSATAEKRYEGFKAINRLLRDHLGSKYYSCFDTSLAKTYFVCAEKSCMESGRYGFSAVVSALSRCPVPFWLSGRTLVAFLISVGFPKIYAAMLQANMIKRI